jgi:hypothetical protein
MAIVQCECIVEVEETGSQWKFDDFVESAIKSVWNDTADVFRSVTVDFGAGPIVIEGDWGPSIREVVEADKMGLQEASKQRLLQDRWPAIRKPDTVSIKLMLSAEQLSPGAALNYGQLYLSLVFLAMNLAVPGSVEFGSVRIKNSEKTCSDNSLSSEHFELIWIDGTHWPWALPREVSLAETWNWLQRLQPMGSQVAHSAVQRALFCLLHASLESYLSPTILIWLCSALETLYDVPDATIARTLRNRVFQLLGRPTNYKVAARQITNLYDQRSKFAHGSFEVVHPLQNDLLDSNVLRIHTAIRPILSLGYTLVVSTLQHMIRNGWRALRFDETLRGEPAPPAHSAFN